jgi:hypothetical protein
MKNMFAITHVNKDGMRTLTFANQGHNHYATREEAEHALKTFTSEPYYNLRRVIGDAAVDTLEVREVRCYDHGDAVGIFFDNHRWRLTFRGRKKGVIGISYRCQITVEAPDRETARLKAYDTHEHIHSLKIELIE